MVAHNALVVSIFLIHDFLDLLLAKRVIDLSLQDIVHLLVIKGEVAYLHIAIENLRFEGHRR